jgi:hypothetical protein
MLFGLGGTDQRNQKRIKQHLKMFLSLLLFCEKFKSRFCVVYFWQSSFFYNLFVIFIVTIEKKKKRSLSQFSE